MRYVITPLPEYTRMPKRPIAPSPPVHAKKDCIEAESLKMYLLAYRSLGILRKRREQHPPRHRRRRAPAVVRRPRRNSPTRRPHHLDLRAARINTKFKRNKNAKQSFRISLTLCHHSAPPFCFLRGNAAMGHGSSSLVRKYDPATSISALVNDRQRDMR